MLIFIIIILLWFISNKEYFYSKAITIDFITPQDACNIFQKLPDVSTYITSFRKNEKTIKNCTTGISSCIQKYCSNFQQFTTTQKSHIYSLLMRIIPKLKAIYPKFDYDNWHIIQSNSQIEGNMPFTISKYIIIPETYINKSMELESNKSIESSIKYLGDILIHEKMHIVQRQNQQLFNKFYQQSWNFSYLSNINIPDNIESKIRSNPDGLDINWIYTNPKNKKKYLPLSLLNSSEDLSSVDIVHYPIFKSNNQYYLKNSLKQNRDYENFFCNLSFAYHPNEISAYLFSEIMLASWNLSKIDYKCPAMLYYLTWLKQQFGK